MCAAGKHHHIMAVFVVYSMAADQRQYARHLVNQVNG